jgi:hypothetical protein
VSPPRQEVFHWEIPNNPEFPETVQTRSRELLSHMLLTVVSGTTDEESLEQRSYCSSLAKLPYRS